MLVVLALCGVAVGVVNLFGAGGAVGGSGGWLGNVVSSSLPFSALCVIIRGAIVSAFFVAVCVL